MKRKKGKQKKTNKKKQTEKNPKKVTKATEADLLYYRSKWKREQEQ